MAESDPNTVWDIAKFVLPIAIGGGGLFAAHRVRRNFIWLNNAWCYVGEKFGKATCGSDEKLTVLVANLYRDEDGSAQEHLRHALREDQALEVLSTNRILNLQDGLSHSDALAKAHEIGDVWLQDRNADLLVWGEAYHADKILRLRFTTRRNREDTGREYHYRENSLELPEKFSSDLGAALIGAIVTMASEDISVAENTAAPLLQARIPGLERICDNPPAGVSEATLLPLRHQLLHAYSIAGGREDDPTFLNKAVALGYTILADEHVPSETENWAMTKNNLGTALSELGSRTDDPARLEGAVAAFEDALRVFTAERTPFYYNATIKNRDEALALLAKFKKEE